MATEHSNNSLKLLGVLAVEKGWVTAEEIKLALQKQKSGKFFGEILLSKNLITLEQLDILLRLQQEAEIRPEDFLFGELAVQNRFIKAEDVVKALEQQKQIHFRKGLGEILIENHWITPQQCQAILATQQRLQKINLLKKKNVSCPKCNTTFHLPDPDRYRKIRCTQCRYIFEVGQPAVQVVVHSEIPNTKPISEMGVNTGKTLLQYLKENDFKPTSEITEPFAHISNESERYVLGGEIARGGMGSIVLTRDINLRRNIVTKILLNRKSRIATLRFIEEAQITGQLEHPNIPPVYDLGLNKDNNIFFTMKHIKGITLEDIIERITRKDKRIIEQYTFTGIAGIFIKICNALDFAHNKNVIHRDIKPENIMIGEYGEVLLMDWGLAKIIGTKEEIEALDETEKVSSVRSEDESSNTIEGTTAGTPAFMSPEQAMGLLEDLDQRSDIYSLGATLYCILELDKPIKGKNIQELLKNVAEGRIGDITRAVPSELKAIAMKAMEYNREDRYQTIREMETDLIYYQMGYSVSAKRDTLFDSIRKIYLRNKLLTIISTIFFISFISLSALFVVSLRDKRDEALQQTQIAERSRERANEALYQAKIALQQFEKEKRDRVSDNKEAAPSLYAKARQEAQIGNIEESTKLMNTVINYDKENLDYRLFRGCLFIVTNNYRQALTDLNSIAKHPAQAEIQRMITLINSAKGVELTEPQKSVLAEIFNTLKLFDLSQHLLVDVNKKLQLWQKRLTTQWTAKFNAKITLVNNALCFQASYINEQLDFSVLKGIPLDSFKMTSNSVLSDISFLDGMNLTEFYISNCPLLLDISPLRNQKLNSLTLVSCGVKDLSPLSKAELKEVTLRMVPLNTLKPILHQPIKTLELYQIALENLAELKALTPETLILNFTNYEIYDLSFINPRNLKNLIISINTLRDISELKNAPLEVLECITNAVIDISPLQNKNIRELHLPASKIQNIAVITTLKNLEVLVINPNYLEPEWENALKQISFQIKRIGVSKTKLMSVTKFMTEFKGYNIQNPKK